MLYGFDKIQNMLMHLNYDFENVNGPYSLLQILYFSFGKSCLYSWKLPDCYWLPDTIVYIEAKIVSRVYFGDGLVGKKGDDTHQQPTP